MRTLIFAGTHAQAEGYRKDQGLTRQDSEYVHSAAALRGRRTSEVPRVFVGTFYSRADAPGLLDSLRVTDLL